MDSDGRGRLFTTVFWLALVLSALVLALTLISQLADRPHHLTTADRLGLAGLIIGVASLSVAAVGFWLALRQIALTRTAAQSASEAARRAVTAMERSQLLIVIQDLRRLEHELDRAVRLTGPDASDIVLRLLREWRDGGLEILAALSSDQMRTLVAISDGKGQGTLELLRDSVSAAADVKGSIVSGGFDLITDTSDLRELIARVSDDLGLIVNNLRTPVEGESSNG